MKALARIEVTLRPEIADPQGQTIARSLPGLGWDNVTSVRVGKHIEVALEGESLEAMRDQVEAMCGKLLANPVLESYTYVVEPAE